ncbi:ABC transporter ATP-binding protein [Bacillus tianshenii]|nr:ABC transporter ATP-binding protein [Bacillus tianshenii]
MEILSIEHATIRKDGKTLLNDVSWKVKQGEHWAILGLNGSGKTMLLNMINGYTWPTSGTVQVLGKTFGTYPLGELRKSIGWVSSSLTERLYEDDYAENIILSGAFASFGLYEEVSQSQIDKALAIMTELGCDSFINRPYSSLSQGEKQRILIGRALMAEPKILILDEPCTGLDIFAKEQLLGTVDKLAKRENAPSIIYVTHHTDEILPLFNRVLCIRDGAVFAAGEREKLLTEESLSAFFNYPIRLHTIGNRSYLTLDRSI